MVKKLDLIKSSMELVQKNPVHAKNAAFEIQASMSKLEMALGKQSERPRRANYAEHSRKSFTDWGEVAAKRKAGREQIKDNSETVRNAASSETVISSQSHQESST